MSGKVVGVEKVSTQFRIMITPLKSILNISEGDYIKFVHSEEGTVSISKVD